jgi:serine/threonine-protein kinase
VVEPGRQCLGDRYELDRLIATGGMGQVWRALDTALARRVAVKVLRSEYTGDPTFLARFRAEAQHAASLSHPNTAAVFDYGEATAQDGTGETLAYLVMELVDGEPLSAVLAREKRLDTATTLSLLRQTAFALAEAHRAGMIHRDVKPGNILVRADGSVKITDFGIAWSARSVALTRTGQVIGTPQYLSPEQAVGRQAGPASDVYALGLIGYECLVGHPAFDGDNAVTIALKQVQEQPDPLPAELPGDVRELIFRALEKDPAARYADGAAFVAAIEAVLEGRPLPLAPRTVALAAAPASRAAATRSTGSRTIARGGLRTAGGSVVRPPAPRRGARVAMVLLPVLGLLAGVAIAAALFQALSRETPGSPAEAAELQQQQQQQQQPVTTVTVVAADHVGRPVEEVVDELTALGLDVARRQVPTDDITPGAVTGVTPDGVLQPGDAVVVSYAVAPGTGGSLGARTVPRTTAVPEAPATSAPPTTDPAPAETVDGAPAGGTTAGASAGGTTGGQTVPGGPATGDGDADGDGEPTGTGTPSTSPPSSTDPSSPSTSPSTSEPTTDSPSSTSPADGDDEDGSDADDRDDDDGDDGDDEEQAEG